MPRSAFCSEQHFGASKRIKWAGLALNGLMLIATPAYGSHYFVDVIAGVLIAALCWIGASRLFGADVMAMDEFDG